VIGRNVSFPAVLRKSTLDMKEWQDEKKREKKGLWPLRPSLGDYGVRPSASVVDKLPCRCFVAADEWA
jgi:hypothetical protein